MNISFRTLAGLLLALSAAVASAQIVNPRSVQSGEGTITHGLLSAGHGVVSVFDYGVVPDDPTKAAANTTALRKLVATPANGGDPKSQFGRTIIFAPGAIYYFDGVIPFRDGIHVDLSGSTLRFSKADSTLEDQAGFIYARRDFSLANGSIEVDYKATVANRGIPIKLNARSRDTDQGVGRYFVNNFEEDQDPGHTVMPVVPGNIELRNLRITSNNPNASVIQLFGGLKNVVMENISIDGRNLAYSGIDYEFGFANRNGDPPPYRMPPRWSSSHGANFALRNIVVKNLNSEGEGTAISIRGAYNVTVDGLVADNVKSVLAFATGEAANYQPGTEDADGVKRNNYFRNIVGQNVTRNGISISGHTDWTGYLSPLTTQSQSDVENKVTDLIEAIVENFTLSGTDNGFGVATSGAKIALRNGRITGFSSGIFETGTRNLMVDAVDVLNNHHEGIRVTVGQIYVSGWTDRRLVVRDCNIAGNGSAGTGHGILFESGQVNALIENNTFGYDNPATGRITVIGGVTMAGVNKIGSLKVDRVEVLSGAVDWTTSNAATAAAIASSINAKTSVHGYTATSYGAEVLIRALPGTGTGPNGYVMAPTVAGDFKIGRVKDMSGGRTELNQLNSVFIASGLKNVIVRENNTRAVAAGGYAYRNQSANPNGNVLANNIGNGTQAGGWGK